MKPDTYLDIFIAYTNYLLLVAIDTYYVHIVDRDHNCLKEARIEVYFSILTRAIGQVHCEIGCLLLRHNKKIKML